MWKDFFYYTKSERRAILLLLVVVAVLLGIAIFKQKDVAGYYAVLPDTCGIDSFLKQLVEADAEFSSPRKQKTHTVPVLHAFDPNTADSVTLLQLGLPAFVVRNILRYRQKGGVFRSATAFSKIYGLSSDDYQRLLPYLSIPEVESKTARTVLSDSVRTVFPKDSFSTLPKLEKGTRISLNTADTTLLKRIPGIGSGIAKRIVAYRNCLGGFYCVEQLREIEYVTPEMNEWFEVSSTDSLVKIPVNKASLERLRNHPYMNFYKARAIIELRRKRGKIKGLPQLSMLEEFTEEDLQRLAPYLAFD